MTDKAEGPGGSALIGSVRPRAWAIFVDNGNARMWSTLQPHVQKLADAEGLTITPLYDQAALNAAVAAERERFTRPEAMAEHALLYAAFDGAPGATTPADVLRAARLLFGDVAVDAALAKYRRHNVAR